MADAVLIRMVDLHRCGADHWRVDVDDDRFGSGLYAVGNEREAVRDVDIEGIVDSCVDLRRVAAIRDLGTQQVGGLIRRRGDGWQSPHRER